jgi:hypothetical protein
MMRRTKHGLKSMIHSLQRLRDSILLGLAHSLERRLDRRIQRQMPDADPPGSRKFRVLVVLLLLVTLALPAISMVPRFQRRPPSPDRQRDQIVARFRADLPPDARIEWTADATARLWHRCSKERSAGERDALRIARLYYDFSEIFVFDDLAMAIRAANPDSFEGERCKADYEIAIPEPLLEPLQNRPLGWDEREPVHAMYLRGENTRPGRLRREVDAMRDIGANGVVFDVKDIIGVVNYRSAVPEVEELRRHAPPIPNLRKTIKYLHDQGVYVIARTALFQDENLAIRRPDLAIKDRSSPGGILLVKGKPLWVDPGQPEVRRYNLKIVQELIELGVDEIQFDYVRYPAEGNLSQVEYYRLDRPEAKTDYLVGFLSGAWMMTRFTGVKISIDVFGIIAWGEEVDIRATGQRLNRMTAFVDVVSPMLYPSHFNAGFDGFDNPADQGNHFYRQGVRRILEQSSKSVVVRPWLQAFRWRVSNYNEDYIREQISGSHAGGGVGWMMWNAGNDYELVYRALRNRGLTNADNRRPDKI